LKHVLHYTWWYLTPTQTFIYGQVANLTSYKPVIITNHAVNLDKFPTRPVYEYPRESQTARKVNNLLFKITRRRFVAELGFFSLIALAYRIKLIHAHFGSCAVDILPISKKLGKPLIVSFYGYDVTEYPNREGAMDDLANLFRFGHKFIVLSNYMQQQLLDLGCPKEKIVILPQGINLGLFNFKPREPKRGGAKVRFLQIANFVEKKGIPYSLEAFAKVKGLHNDCEFHLIGDGPMRTDIEKKVAALGLTDSVAIKGFKRHDELPAELHAADILLHPSIAASSGDTEGLPTLIMEAMATGLPVIATRHAAIPDLVVPHKTGILVEEKDVDGLASAMLSIVQNQEAWSDLGKAGRKHIESNFEIKRQVQKLEAIYDELVDE